MHPSLFRTSAAFACVALVAVGLAGCGSGSSTTGTASKTLTVTEFKARANAICKAGNAEIKKVGATLSETSTEAEVVTALNKSADLADKEVTDIRKLQAPASIAADVTAMLDAVNTATAAIRRDGIKAIGGPDPFKDADARAKALGLDACASSAGT